MASKPSLKTFLKAASMTCAFICATDANAGVYVTGDSAAIRSDAYNSTANWATVQNGQPLGNAQNNWIVLGGLDNIIANVGVIVLSLDVNDQDGRTITVTGGVNTALGSIVDSSGNGKKIDISFDGIGGAASMVLNNMSNPHGTSAGGPIAASDLSGLGLVNLDNNGTFTLSNIFGDISYVRVYGAGTFNVLAQAGTPMAAGQTIILGGILGDNAGNATNMTIALDAGTGNFGSPNAGGGITLGGINTTQPIFINQGGGGTAGAGGAGANGNAGGGGGNILIQSPVFGGIEAKGGRGGPGAGAGHGVGGHGGNVTFSADITNNTVLVTSFTAGDGGGSGALDPGGDGGDISLQSITETPAVSLSSGSGGYGNEVVAGGNGGNINIAGLYTSLGGFVQATTGTNGRTHDPLAKISNAGNITFGRGVDFTKGGYLLINPGDGLVIIKGSITGRQNQEVIGLYDAKASVTIDSTSNPIAVVGQIMPKNGINYGILTANIMNSHNITFGDSIGQNGSPINTLNIQSDGTASPIFNASVYVGTATVCTNNPAIFLGSGALFSTADMNGAFSLSTTSGASATLNATNINTGAQPITLGAASPGATLNFTNTTFIGSGININGAGVVSFTNSIPAPINFLSDSTVVVADGTSINANVTANNMGTLASSGSVSVTGVVSGVKSIQFNTLKVVPGNFVLSSPATIGTVDFNNGGSLAMGNGGALTYGTFANTDGASQINATGTSSITSTSIGSSTLPLITTSGNTTFTGNINVANIQTTGSGLITLNSATVSGGVTGAVAIGSGASTISTTNSSSLNFTSSGGQLAITSANQINNITTVTTNGGGTLILSGGTLASDIATPASPLTSLQLTGGSRLDNNGRNIYVSSLMPIATGVNLNLAGGSLTGSAGSASNPFSNVTLNNFTATNDMYALNFNIANTVKLNNSHLNGSINLGSNSSLDATNGTIAGSIIGSGNITIGQTTLSNPIGASGSNVGIVTLTPTQHTLSNDIYGTSVVADNSLLILSNSVQVANLSAQNLMLTPNTNSLILPSGGNLTGLTTLNLTLNSLTTNTTPYINVTGGTLNLYNMQISITDNVGVGNSGAQIFIIGGSNNYSGTPNITDTKLITWTYDNTTGLLSSGLNHEAIDKVVKSLQSQIPNIRDYFQPDNTGDAFLAEELIAEATPEQAMEIITQIQSVNRDVPQEATINDATLENIRNVLDQQTNDYFADALLFEEQLSTEADLGVAAGEEENKSRRVWVSATKTGKSEVFIEPAQFNQFRIVGFSGSGFGGFSDLGRIKGASGSRTKTYGCSTGIDTRISERWMLGGAFTYTENTTAMHNTLIGSTYHSKGWVATLYGLYNATNNWSVRTGLSYGNSKNINDARRLVQLPSVYRIAYASYNSHFISPDISTSYRIALPNKISFVPSVGLQYIYTQAGTYKESGARPLNMTVKKRPERGALSGNIGLSFSTAFKLGDALIKPEIHGAFKRALKGRNPTTLSKLDGATSFIQTRSHPTKKVTYSVGGSVTVGVSKTLDIGVGYDASLGEKYRAHRGSLKIRVNL